MSRVEHETSSGKHPEIVLGEYLAADSPGEWLMDEVGGYLFSGSSEDDRLEATDKVFERVDDERREFIGKQLEPDTLVRFSVEVDKNGRTLRASFSEFPTPLILLDMCLRIADPGDEVSIMHTYANGGNVLFEGVWPFGMDWAVRATAPMGKSFYDEEAEEIEELEDMVFQATNTDHDDDDDDDDDDDYRLTFGFYDQGDLPRWLQRRETLAAVFSSALGVVALAVALSQRKRR